MFGDPNDITSETITPAQQAAWYDVIGKFEAYAQQFDAAQADLASQASWIATQDADTQTQYNDLVSRGNTTRATITSVQNALADVKNALAGAWDAVTGAWNATTEAAVNVQQGAALSISDFFYNLLHPNAPYSSGVSGLGFLPLIPIAIVAAAVAALAYFLNDYAQFSQKVKLLQQGYTPAQVQQAVGSSGGLTSTLGTMVWIIGGIAALIFLPKLIEGYRRSVR